MAFTAISSAQYNPFTSIYEFDQRSSGPSSSDTMAIPSVLIELPQQKISTSALNEAFPDKKIPSDSLSFRFPDLSEYVDTAGILWLLKKDYGVGKPILSLMIIGMLPDTNLHYFLDFDHDGKYNDPENPVVLSNDEASRRFIIRPTGWGSYSLNFNNPLYSGLDAQEKKDKEAKGDKKMAEKRNKSDMDSNWQESRKKPRIILGSKLIIGPGKTVMEFDPMTDESVKHRKFTADIFSSGGLAMEAGIAYHGFRTGVTLSAELLMYSGFREYITSTDPNTGLLRTNWNSHGNWPSTRVTYGGFLEYDLRVNRELRITPFVSWSKYLILSDHYFIRNIRKSVGETFTDTYMYASGLKFKFVTGNNHMLYVSGYYQSSHFDARSYFDDIDPDSYTMWFRQYCLSMGFEYRLGNK